ncbi:MAG: S-layer homology domain-containing protein, partial [Firmicutes bacterium]|nr:S-layer homology domain-containing protein [Bacillota bacterium]
MKKALISSLLTASLTLGSVFTGFVVSAAPSYAASFSDINNHWAKDYILDAANKNIISGYPDGTFLPDKPVTRAEFTKMVNNALGNNATSSVTFTDVPAAEWYHNEISKAVAAGYAG